MACEGSGSCCTTHAILVVAGKAQGPCRGDGCGCHKPRTIRMSQLPTAASTFYDAEGNAVATGSASTDQEITVTYFPTMMGDSAQRNCPHCGGVL